MTLNLVLKKGFYPKEYICEIRKLYHLPFKSYGQCKKICGQTNGQTDRRTSQKLYFPPPDLSVQGHKKGQLLRKCIKSISLDGIGCSFDSEHLFQVLNKYLQ